MLFESISVLLNRRFDVNLNARDLKGASALVYGVVFAGDVVEAGRDGMNVNEEGILLLYIFGGVR